MPHVLITNDDGVHAPGILALAQALQTLGKVTVFAPERNWSASGHDKTMDRPLRVRETHLADGTPALTSDGSPADCIALALLGVIQEPVDVVVSGINAGENLGQDMTYSGTVTAAMEGALAGLPAVAVSMKLPANGSKPDFSAAAQIALRVVERVLRFGLPPRVVLNVNVPPLPLEQIKGIRITRLGERIYRDALVTRYDPRHKPYYWIGGEPPDGVPEEGTDIGALAEGYASITPLHLDLTLYSLMESLRQWNWEEE